MRAGFLGARAFYVACRDRETCFFIRFLLCGAWAWLGQSCAVWMNCEKRDPSYESLRDIFDTTLTDTGFLKYHIVETRNRRTPASVVYLRQLTSNGLILAFERVMIVSDPL